MIRGDESLIRDADLRERLEEARGKFGFDVQVRALITSQERRDAEKAKQEAKDAHRASLPREQRRRFDAFETIETEGPSPENLRYMPTPLAICVFRRASLTL